MENRDNQNSDVSKAQQAQQPQAQSQQQTLKSLAKDLVRPRMSDMLDLYLFRSQLLLPLLDRSRSSLSSLGLNGLADGLLQSVLSLQKQVQSNKKRR